MPMRFYHFGPVLLRSSMPMPELAAATAEDLPVIDVEVARSEAPPRGTRWYHHRTTPDGQVQLSLGRNAGGFSMRFTDGPSFQLSEDGTRIACPSFADALRRASTRHILLNQVLPHALSLRGYLTLHASVVGNENGALAFMGKSGQGKSTLLAALLAAQTPRGKRAVRLISDDCLIVRRVGERLMAVPSYPCLRLRLKSGERTALGPSAGLPFELQPVPLRRIYLLDPIATGAARAIDIPRRDAFVAAMEHSFQLHTSCHHGLEQGFQGFADLMLARICRLQLPWDAMANLPNVAAALLDGRLKSNSIVQEYALAA